jgi:hypothetical protein
LEEVLEIDQFKDASMLKSKVSVKRLDELMDWVDRKPNGKIETIFALIQLLAVFAYIWTRNKLVESEWEIRKQEYAREETMENREEIAEEDMDGK